MTEMLTWLGAWYNLLPVFCVLLSTGFALIQIFFGFLPDSMDADIDADGDIDLDLDLDIDADVDLDVDVDVDVDADVDASGGAFEGLGGTVLAFAGFGKAQTSLLLMMLVFLFGACSLLLSWLLGPLPGIPVAGWLVVVGVYCASLFLAAGVTGRCAALLNKVSPKSKTVTKPASSLVGKSATAATSITPRGGQAKLGSRYIQVLSTRGTINRGSRVLIVAYDAKRLAYTVESI
jgi:membrane protein implicated in regulation of membrane protease activity